ncbi:hypothetical protein ES705_41628 [subsurface metagenome]
MGWDPFKDVGDFFSDVGKGIGKVAEDLWKSDVVQIYVPAVVGYAIGGSMGAVAGGSLGYSSVQRKGAFEKAEKLQERGIAAQRESQLRQAELAGQQYTLTEKQMELQMGQRQIEHLADVYSRQDRTEPTIYYLPTAEPTSPVERINRAIDDFLRK